MRYRPLMLLMAPLFLGVHAAASAANYCEQSSNACVVKSDSMEHGKTKDGLRFILRPDGSGCFGYFGATLDCQPNAFSGINDKGAWQVACFVEGGARACTATDGAATKMRAHETEGWQLGIGINNYGGAPVRLRKGKTTQELKVEDGGWLPRTRFAELYRHMTTPPQLRVEWVEEEDVKWGPKWHPGSVDAKLVKAVFDYMTWATANKDLRPLPQAVANGTRQRRNIDTLDCYSLRLGAPLNEAVELLGLPDETTKDFVNSAGQRGVTLSWSSEKALCSARFQPALTHYSIRDTKGFDSKQTK